MDKTREDVCSLNADDILQQMKSAFIDQDYVLENRWKVEFVHIYPCTEGGAYEEKRKELKFKGHSTDEMLGFLMLSSNQRSCYGVHLHRLTSEFMKKHKNCNWSPTETLGDFDEGVAVYKSADPLLKLAELKRMRAPKIVVYKVMPGRRKVHFCYQNNLDPISKPLDVNYDCYEAELDSDISLKCLALQFQLQLSEMFLYDWEYAGQSNEHVIPSTCPRQVLPVAVIHMRALLSYILPKSVAPHENACHTRILSSGTMEVRTQYPDQPHRKNLRKIRPKSSKNYASVCGDDSNNITPLPVVVDPWKALPPVLAGRQDYCSSNQAIYTQHSSTPMTSQQSMLYSNITESNLASYSNTECQNMSTSSGYYSNLLCQATAEDGLVPRSSNNLLPTVKQSIKHVPTGSATFYNMDDRGFTTTESSNLVDADFLNFIPDVISPSENAAIPKQITDETYFAITSETCPTSNDAELFKAPEVFTDSLKNSCKSFAVQESCSHPSVSGRLQQTKNNLPLSLCSLNPCTTSSTSTSWNINSVLSDVSTARISSDASFQFDSFSDIKNLSVNDSIFEALNTLLLDANYEPNITQKNGSDAEAFALGFPDGSLRKSLLTSNTCGLPSSGLCEKEQLCLFQDNGSNSKCCGDEKEPENTSSGNGPIVSKVSLQTVNRNGLCMNGAFRQKSIFFSSPKNFDKDANNNKCSSLLKISKQVLYSNLDFSTNDKYSRSSENIDVNTSDWKSSHERWDILEEGKCYSPIASISSQSQPPLCEVMVQHRLTSPNQVNTQQFRPKAVDRDAASCKQVTLTDSLPSLHSVDSVKTKPEKSSNSCRRTAKKVANAHLRNRRCGKMSTRSSACLKASYSDYGDSERQSCLKSDVTGNILMTVEKSLADHATTALANLERLSPLCRSKRALSNANGVPIATNNISDSFTKETFTILSPDSSKIKKRSRSERHQKFHGRPLIVKNSAIPLKIWDSPKRKARLVDPRSKCISVAKCESLLNRKWAKVFLKQKQIQNKNLRCLDTHTLQNHKSQDVVGCQTLESVYENPSVRSLVDIASTKGSHHLSNSPSRTIGAILTVSTGDFVSQHDSLCDKNPLHDAVDKAAKNQGATSSKVQVEILVGKSPTKN